MTGDNDPQLGPVARRLAATERVLSIEDEPDIAMFLRAYFRAAGYDLVHVDPADTGEIIAAVEENSPDCILLDVRLRGFSGLDAYHLLRADERWAFTPIIIVSAHASADPAFVAPQKSGLDAFVPKPFNTNTLADLVKERIEHARALHTRGHDSEFPLLSQDYVEARLSDELAMAMSADVPLSFALVTLRGFDAIAIQVGHEGRNWVITQLLSRARELLPTDAVLGSTRTDEVALILPRHDLPRADAALRPVLEALVGEMALPGGASVQIDIVGGLASYPINAGDVDGLFMAADSALADATTADELLRSAV